MLQAGHDVVIFGCSSLSASVVGRTSIAELLFVIFYFYNFIHQRLGADIAMNSLPAAIPDRYMPFHLRSSFMCGRTKRKVSKLFSRWFIATEYSEFITILTQLYNDRKFEVYFLFHAGLW